MKMGLEEEAAQPEAEGTPSGHERSAMMPEVLPVGEGQAARDVVGVPWRATMAGYH